MLSHGNAAGAERSRRNGSGVVHAPEECLSFSIAPSRLSSAAAAQRALVALSHLDAHTLRDIGLTRHGSREAGLDAVNDNPDRARDCA